MPRNRSRKQTERALEAQLEKEANAERRRNQGASKKQKAQRDRARAAARQAITDACAAQQHAARSVCPHRIRARTLLLVFPTLPQPTSKGSGVGISCTKVCVT